MIHTVLELRTDAAQPGASAVNSATTKLILAR